MTATIIGLFTGMIFMIIFAVGVIALLEVIAFIESTVRAHRTHTTEQQLPTRHSV